MGGGKQTYLHIVSTSMPENPKALSPSTQTTLWPLFLLLSTAAAAIAKPRPTPIVPNVPASNLHVIRINQPQATKHVQRLKDDNDSKYWEIPVNRGKMTEDLFPCSLHTESSEKKSPRRMGAA